MVQNQTEMMRDGRALLVLVVDDNTDAADSLGLLVRMWGHDVRVAYDGAGILETAAACRPDAILLDIGLPRVDGYCLARQLRQQPGLQGLLLVAVTGYADAEHRALSREAGFDHYLVKPVDPDELQRLLGTLLERPRPDQPAPSTPCVPDFERQETLLLTDTQHEIVLEFKEAVAKAKEALRQSPQG
jgi:DNA-binding response OmpR family regulator